MNYSDAIAKPPKTLTDSEQRLLLKVSGEHCAGFRDYVIFSMALPHGDALPIHVRKYRRPSFFRIATDASILTYIPMMKSSV